MPLVTGIRTQRSFDLSHDHIVGVWTSEGAFRTNRQVVESMQRGEVWDSTGGAAKVRMGWIRWCPGMNCRESPYLISTGALHRHITTGMHIVRAPHSPDSLENLPSTGPPPIGAEPEVAASAAAAGGKAVVTPLASRARRRAESGLSRRDPQ